MNSTLYKLRKRQKSAVLLLLALLMTVALAACEGMMEGTLDIATETPEEMAVVDEPALERTAEPLPSVTVAEQEIVDNTVTIPVVTAAEQGWLVIHADENGVPGPVIGQSPVDVGENLSVVVEIDPANATETLHAMLHVDAGTEGVYEFPGDDGPVTVDGNVVSVPFAVSGLETGMIDEVTPSVTVEDQALAEGSVTVPLVTAAEPGWIVIHADDNGAPGPVIGQSPVAVGNNIDVAVMIDESGATETLHAMLHIDAGTEGVYEFPGDDGPVTLDGNIVMQPFTVTGLEAGMDQDMTPSVTVEDQDVVDGAVNVPLVVAAEPGWIVIHADENGAPGPVIGQSMVEAGQNEDVAVSIDEAAATETLYAMLHLDTGTAGTYEFPGEDGPVTVDGNVVVEPFAVMLSRTEGMSSGETVVALELVAEGLTAPVVFKPFPDGSGRHAIADQVGVVHVLDSEGVLLEQPFLDLRDRMVELSSGYSERGLLGLAFHPEYADNGRFFAYYSAPLRDGAPADWDNTSHIAAFEVSDDPNIADPASEQILLQVDQPQGNHNAGALAFGPDGYLYIPLGDGGAADDVATGHVSDWYEFNEGGNGQDLSENLLGSILRIDVDSQGADGQPYGIPANNPFVDAEDIASEQWAYGFRNPFRLSFDMGGDNALYVSDAGQNRWEEVSLVESGGNYGWNVKEGTHCFDAANPDQALDECPDADNEGDPLIDPIIEYPNANQADGIGLVVIGGYVYRGEAFADMDGAYFFGDWSDDFTAGNGKIFLARPAEGDGLWSYEQLSISNTESGDLDRFLLSFGQDENGEIYVLTSASSSPSGESGRIFRLVPPEMVETMMGGEATADEEMTSDEAATEDDDAAVTIDNFSFNPSQLTVPVGTTVTWTNQNGVAHTVTAGTPDAPNEAFFDSGSVGPEGTFSFTFDEAGSYSYFCQFHQQMRGTIVVEG